MNKCPMATLDLGIPIVTGYGMGVSRKLQEDGVTSQ